MVINENLKNLTKTNFHSRAISIIYSAGIWEFDIIFPLCHYLSISMIFY